MKIRHFGYACINSELNAADPRVSSSRTIRKATYESEGLARAGGLALQNAKDLLTIIKWNQNNNIKFFRISSDILPWKSRWHFRDIDTPLRHDLFDALREIGDFARIFNHRLTMHPGPFNKLCSPKERVVQNTIRELEDHNEIFELMGFEPSYRNKINIHLGAAYGDKPETAKRWCKNFKRLSNRLQKRITIENDDRGALYDTKDLYDMVYQETGVPIVFDFHHHRLHNLHKDMNEQECAELAVSTWPKDIVPVMHWSESRREEKHDNSISTSAHSDLCHGPLPDYKLSRPVDLMIEAKNKEQALFTLQNNE